MDLGSLGKAFYVSLSFADHDLDGSYASDVCIGCAS